MKLLLMFFGFILNSNIVISPLNIDDVIYKSKIVADKHFIKDAMGNRYARKPWRIYYKFVDNNSLKNLLSSKNTVVSLDTNLKLILIKKTEIKPQIVFTKLIKADNSFNLIEIQRPIYNKTKKLYSSVLWIRDKSWTSGFCICFDFKIIGNKCLLYKTFPITVSDIQDL